MARARLSAKETPMNRAYLPFLFLPSHSLAEAVGGDIRKIAVLALRAVLQHRKGLEVAHQQITFGELHVAMSTRITSTGELVVELDVGDPRLQDRLILEDELRQAAWAGRQMRGVRGPMR
jgi:hypothetical protein